MSTEQSTNSGEIEDLRDQIFLLIRLSFFFIRERKTSTKLPFHMDRRGIKEILTFTTPCPKSCFGGLTPR
jgi:hypothetical protein